MPRRAKGPRLWWRAESWKSDGSLRNAAGWFIRDGQRILGTGCGATDRAGAEIALAQYIAAKHRRAEPQAADAGATPIADVIAAYLTDIAPGHARPAETAARLERVLAHFGPAPITAVNDESCRRFAAAQATPAAARRALEDLRAALNHWRVKGFTGVLPVVTLPAPPPARERWLTRVEAAAWLRALWRAGQRDATGRLVRPTGRHAARFLLLALYTGTRSAAICAAALRPTPGRGHVDLERGVFYRRAPGARETKKRQPPVPLPDRLLAHLRRWARLGIAENHVVEWNGKPVASVRKALAAGRRAAGLGPEVTAHVARHTAATWLAQSGIDLWRAAEFLGMTTETFERRYAHHSPHHLAEVRNAVRSPAAPRSPQFPHRMGMNERERMATNVTRLHDVSRS